MPNLSQLKRERMLAFLQKIKDEHRDKDNQLDINNTEFTEDMADDHWVPLQSEF